MGGENRSRRKPGTTSRARLLRTAGNQSEAHLWNELKDRQLGEYKVVRQMPLGPYFADFACRQRRLVVEVDGNQHANSGRDRLRDAFMLAAGWSILRFWNVDVLKETAATCETILAALEGRIRENVTTADMRFLKAKSAGEL
ncbi:MAG: endonuclease domain-containing protein [Rhizobiaceae bacterium]|nr:endonuclease domain-containing protein [Rhizobiaceae bacterium]